MRFARFVFVTAGVWGIVVLSPLLFLLDISGRRYAAPADYPHFFYGFVTVALAWQVAFLIIGSNPHRYRPFMVMAVIEKLGFVATCTWLWLQGRISTLDASAGIPDTLLGVLFIAAFIETRSAGHEPIGTAAAAIAQASRSGAEENP